MNSPLLIAGLLFVLVGVLFMWERRMCRANQEYLAQLQAKLAALDASAQAPEHEPVEDPHALIYTLAHTLYGTALNGAIAGSLGAREAIDWMSKPQPGDLVFELSSYYRVIGHPGARWPRDLSRVYGAVGTLESIGKQPVHTEAQWEEYARAEYEAGGEPRPMETVYNIKSLKDGNLLPWTNCQFIRIPLTNEPWRTR